MKILATLVLLCASCFGEVIGYVTETTYKDSFNDTSYNLAVMNTDGINFDATFTVYDLLDNQFSYGPFTILVGNGGNIGFGNYSMTIPWMVTIACEDGVTFSTTGGYNPTIGGTVTVNLNKPEPVSSGPPPPTPEPSTAALLPFALLFLRKRSRFSD